MELVSIQSRVPIKSIAAKINVLVYQRNLSSNRFFLHFLPFVISQSSINQTLSRQVLQFTWNTCDSVIKIEEDGGRRDFWKLFHHSYIYHSRLIAANNSYILPCRVRNHSRTRPYTSFSARLPHPSKGERRREKEASKDWRVAAIDHDALRWSGTADCASRGGTKRRGRGLEGEGRRPCPQLRTGYVKQPGRPAGRCVRLTCLPALLEDKRSWQGCLAPLNPSFSCLPLPPSRGSSRPSSRRITSPHFFPPSTPPLSRPPCSFQNSCFRTFEIERDGKGRSR